VIYECECRLTIKAPADTVWHWMSDVRRLLSLNLFHAAVTYPEPVRQSGLRIPVRHSIFGLYRRTRMARIHTYEKYVVAWGELQEEGIDRFPHSQSFKVVPIDAQTCMIINRLRGKFRLPAGRYWFLPFYRWLAPRLLADENRQIAAAVAAMQAKLTLPTPHDP
jgi:ligand-binding SRPBCC domain-containing protein